MKVFKPKYVGEMYFAFVLFGLFEIILFLIHIFSQNPRNNILIIPELFIPLLIIFILSKIPKEILIDNNIQINRYLFKPKLIDYYEIKDITLNAIYLKKGKYVLRSIKNSEELVNLIKTKLQNIGIGFQFLENKAEIKEEAQSKSILYAALIVSPIVAYLIFNGKNIHANQATLMVLLLSLVLYPFIKMILNKRNKS